MTDRTAALRALIEAMEEERVEDIDLLACDIWHMDGMCREPLDAYNGSLDAAKALHEALLPGWSPGISQNIHSGFWFAWVQNDARHFAANESCPARAWLLAILRAYLSQQEAA